MFTSTPACRDNEQDVYCLQTGARFFNPSHLSLMQNKSVSESAVWPAGFRPDVSTELKWEEWQQEDGQSELTVGPIVFYSGGTTTHLSNWYLTDDVIMSGKHT